MQKAKIMRVERNWFLRRRRELFDNQKAEGKNVHGFFDNHAIIDPGNIVTCDFSGDPINTQYVDVYVSPYGKEYALSGKKSDELQQDGCKVEMHDSCMTDANPASQIVS